MPCKGGPFSTMSEASANSYNSNYRGHVCDMDQCVLQTSLQLHNFGRRFYGCRHWKPAATNIVSPLSGWMASHVGVELKQHQLSLRNLLGLRPRQLWQETIRWKPVQ